MIDLHTHTMLSDGALLPEELISRCAAKGFRCLAICDHVGFSNVERVVAEIRRTCAAYEKVAGIKVLPGAEVTHVHPKLIAEVVALARKAGARIVIGHGETLVEPVPEGTNRAYIEAGVDAVAHPGLISEEDAALAAEAGIFLEISGRQGHCLTNGHVASVARKVGANLSFGSDSHGPSDLRDRADATRVLRGAGLSVDEVETLFTQVERLFD